MGRRVVSVAPDPNSAYDRTFRLYAIARAEDLGSISEAAAELGIKPNTLRTWQRRLSQAKRAPWPARYAVAKTEQAASLRARMRQDLLIAARLCAQELASRDMAPRDRRDLAHTIALLVDKWRLEMGEATSRAEVDIRESITAVCALVGVDPELPEDERDRLIAERLSLPAVSSARAAAAPSPNGHATASVIRDGASEAAAD